MRGWRVERLETAESVYCEEKVERLMVTRDTIVVAMDNTHTTCSQ